MDEELLYIRSENLKRIEKEFWIDNYGLIHKFKGDIDIDYVSIHYQIANELFPNLTNPEKHIEELGYIKVGSIVYHGCIMEKEPSSDQVNTMIDLGLIKRLYVNRNGYYEKYSD